VSERLNTVIVGGGQAGLAISYYLKQEQRDHVVLERSTQAANTWRNHRWDSFTLVTPKWQMRLPGAEYDGDDPDGFMPRDGIVAYLERYAEGNHLPVRYGVNVSSIEPRPGNRGWIIRTDQGAFEADNVVVATGLFQQPRVPAAAAGLTAAVAQLTSDQYRSPEALAPGAVLVVGSGQSGAQIAEELYQSGRRVFLSVGTAGRAPRRYRGRDTTWWLYKFWMDQTVDSLPSPKARFAANPAVTGKDGGHALNLHQFYRDGVVLLGHLQDAREGRLILKPDLHESLEKVDRFEADLLKGIDEAIAARGIDAPEETVPVLRDGYAAPQILDLDVKTAGIGTVIWATGYTFDFGLVKVPVTDEFGYPVQRRGVTAYKGLYFLGLPWLHTAKSGLFAGVGEDAAYLAEQIAAAPGERLTAAPARTGVAG